jgi:hypothetical protein
MGLGILPKETPQSSTVINVSVDARGSNLTEAQVSRMVKAGVQEGIKEYKGQIRESNLRFKGVQY